MASLPITVLHATSQCGAGRPLILATSKSRKQALQVIRGFQHSVIWLIAKSLTLTKIKRYTQTHLVKQ